jgi:hypothetical protein
VDRVCGLHTDQRVRFPRHPLILEEADVLPLKPGIEQGAKDLRIDQEINFAGDDQGLRPRKTVGHAEGNPLGCAHWLMFPTLNPPHLERMVTGPAVDGPWQTLKLVVGMSGHGRRWSPAPILALRIGCRSLHPGR